MKRKATLFVLLCVLWGILTGDTAFAGEKSTLQFFFENVCASCHEEDKFYELFNRCISIEEKESLSYEIRTYNIFLESNREAYEDLCEKTGRDSDQVLPALLLNGQWLNGYEEIEEQLHAVLIEGREAAETPSGQSSSDEAPMEEASDEAETFQIPVPEAEDDERAVLFFSTWSCADCEEAKAYLEELQEQIPFSLTEQSIAQGNGISLFKELLKVYGREEKDGKVPAVFVGDRALMGKEEIQSELPGLLAEEKSRSQYLKERLSKVTGGETIGKVSIFTMFGAGLLAGFNPCSISMLLMLFSILLTTHVSVWKNGLLYLVGKYLTYLGIGIGICMTAMRIDQSVLEKFGNIINKGIVVLFLIVAVMNFLDFLHVRKNEYGKIRMQLPKELRRFNHKLLKKAGRTEGALLSLVVLGLGIAISLGEFFCTGQIYMASILYTLRNAQDQFLKLTAALLVYVTAMSIPAICIVGIIHRTKGTGRISDFMLKHMGAIKLLNSILFLLYAVYFIIPQ